MIDLESLFSSQANSGLYSVGDHFKNSEIQKIAEKYKLETILVNLSRVRTKLGLLRRIARSFNFPAYFGSNWDALKDSLTDLSWRPASGYVVIVRHFQLFKDEASSDFEITKDIFESCALFWKDQGKPFFVILFN
ncbi:MAG: barstar family protein [Dehalogenimonas sp.]